MEQSGRRRNSLCECYLRKPSYRGEDRLDRQAMTLPRRIRMSGEGEGEPILGLCTLSWRAGAAVRQPLLPAAQQASVLV